MGTPERIIVPRLRAKRLRAIFWNNGPNTGAFNFSGSTTSRTPGLCLIFRQTMRPTMANTMRTGK